MTTPIWVAKEALLLLHRESLRQFGGADGLRDEGLLDSALARPLNRFASQPEFFLREIHQECRPAQKTLPKHAIGSPIQFAKLWGFGHHNLDA